MMLEEKRRIEDTGFTTADAGPQDLLGTVMTQVFATLLWENKFTSMSSKAKLLATLTLFSWVCSFLFSFSHYIYSPISLSWYKNEKQQTKNQTRLHLCNNTMK